MILSLSLYKNERYFFRDTHPVRERFSSKCKKDGPIKRISRNVDVVLEVDVVDESPLELQWVVVVVEEEEHPS